MRGLCRPLARRGAFLALMLALGSVPAVADTYGVTVAPFGRTEGPGRRALIIAPGALTGPTAARDAVAQADARRYRDLLRHEGFDVTTIVGETRLGLELGVKAFAGNAAGADVAVFVLGYARPKGDALFVFPAGDSPSRDTYETEGLPLSRLLEMITEHGPKQTVALVDECRGDSGAPCHVGPTTVPDGVSLIVSLRRAGDDSGAPVAGLASLGTEALPLMQQEGLDYLAFFSALKQRLDGTNMTLVSSSSLTREFAFLPADFFAHLDDACNRVDPDATAATLRAGPSVAPLIGACERAAQTWSAWPYFQTRLAAAREEAAFQRAVSSCDTTAAQDFLATYATSRLAPAVSEARDVCQARRAQEAAPPPAPAASSELTCTVGGLDPNGDNWLALRQGPNPHAPWSTTHMGPGTVVQAFEQNGPWMHVRLASGEIGWASRHFLSCGSEAPLPSAGARASSCVVAGLDPAGNNWLALREQPSFQAAWSSTQMGPGTPLVALERYGQWLHVRLRSGETGWANGHFVHCSE